MTQKELLYIEDALEHERQLEEACNDFADMIENEDLKKLLETLSQNHKKHMNKFYNLLNL